MMEKSNKSGCGECGASLNRRSFLSAAAGVAAAGLVAPGLLGMRGVHAAPSAKSAAETAAAKFYATLSAEQKSTIGFEFNNELRSRINANWHVTKPTIGSKFYTDEQRGLIKEIVKGVTSPEGFERLTKQMDEDAGGIGEFSAAVFGEPGGKFEFELTGRHLTLRADGNSVDQAAFGGPIIYGHGEENPKDNLYHYQTKHVNEVFKALDAKQAEKALLKQAPAESAVNIQGDAGKFPGLAISELSADQKKLVEKTLKTLFAPYRSEDVDEVFEIVKASGGIDKLHLAFYQQGDLGNDKVWDIWRVEGPRFVWHFRGAPHVHAYINISGPQA